MALTGDALPGRVTGRRHTSFSPVREAMTFGVYRFNWVRQWAAAMALLALSAFVVPTETSAAQWYWGLAVGGNTSGDVTVVSRSNDRASLCDEYINPRALAVSGCTAPDRGYGDGWQAHFARGRGLSIETELGLRVSPRFRLAVSYAHHVTRFDQTVSSSDATGVDFDKISNELSIGEETLDTATSDELFVMGYRDWPNRTRWTPYAGLGLGIARPRMDFSWLWARSADSRDIATGAGQPNAAEIRRNLAGTVSVGRERMRDTLTGYALVLGVDRRFSEVLSFGFRAQWKHFEAFESRPYQGELVRSHAPNLRLDGSEPVSTRSRTNDTSRFSALFTIRYALP